MLLINGPMLPPEKGKSKILNCIHTHTLSQKTLSRNVGMSLLHFLKTSPCLSDLHGWLSLAISSPPPIVTHTTRNTDFYPQKLLKSKPILRRLRNTIAFTVKWTFQLSWLALHFGSRNSQFVEARYPGCSHSSMWKAVPTPTFMPFALGD